MINAHPTRKLVVKSSIQAALVIFAAIITPAEAAQPIDCDHILHSKTPFQLTRIDRSNNTSIKTQTYRSDNDFATTYRAMPSWVNKVVTQRGLVRSSRLPNGEQISYSYDVAVKGYFFEDATYIEKTAHRGNITQRDILEITKSEDDDLSVGPCIVHVNHFTVNYVNNKVGVVSQELWYSKELDAALKTVNHKRDKDGKEVAEALDVTDIQTDFVPLQ